MTYKESFEKRKDRITSNKSRLTAFAFIYKYLPTVVFAAYPILLIYLFARHDERLIRCIAVPLFMFITLSEARYLINKERPYEKYDITPIFPKDTKGKSFPSRHTASAAVIAVTFFYISLPLGVTFLIISALIAASRVIGGVHFPRDVIAGIVYALLCGVLLFIK